MSKAYIFGLALAFCLFGCGGGSAVDTSNQPSSNVQPPSKLRVAYGNSLGDCVLSWDAYNQPYTCFALEERIPGETSQWTNTQDWIPGGFRDWLHYFSKTPVEGTRTGFRLYAIFGGERSAYSNEVFFVQRPNAPRFLSQKWDFEKGTITVSWDRNSTFADNYRLERTNSNEHGDVMSPWYELSGTEVTSSVFIDRLANPGGFYRYRLTNLKGELASYSTISELAVASVPAVTGVWANWDPVQACATLRWSIENLPAMGQTRVERAETDSSGIVRGIWATLGMVEGATTSFQDKGVTEGTYVAYRVTPVIGTGEGAVGTNPLPLEIPLLAPVHFRVTATTKGIRLDWDNQSRAATGILIQRSPSTSVNKDIAWLDPTTTTFEDQSMPIGYHTYHVVAKKDALESPSEYLNVSTVNAAGALNISEGIYKGGFICGSLMPGGGWARGSLRPFGVSSDDSSWPAFFPSGTTYLWKSDFVRVDPLGVPHLLYARSEGTSTQDNSIIHAWWGGVEWQEEVVATTNLHAVMGGGFDFAIDALGNLHLLLDHATSTETMGHSTTTLSYIYKYGGTYVSESLSSMTSDIFNKITQYQVQVDGQGRPHLLLANGSSVIHYSKTVSGAWSASTLPTGNVMIGTFDILKSCWMDEDNGWTFFERPDGLGYDLIGLQRKAGAWLDPVVISSRVDDGSWPCTNVAMSQDGSRIVIYQKSTFGERLFHLNATGWVGTLLGPNCAIGFVPVVPIGFDAGKKFHLQVPILFLSFDEYVES